MGHINDFKIKKKWTTIRSFYNILQDVIIGTITVINTEFTIILQQNHTIYKLS